MLQKTLDLELKLAWESFQDDICLSAHEVVSSNIWKRIFQIVLEKDSVFKELDWQIDAKELIDTLFNPDKKLSLDEAIFLLERLDSSIKLIAWYGKTESGYTVFENGGWYNYWKKDSAALYLFEKLAITGKNKHNLLAHIKSIWGEVDNRSKGFHYPLFIEAIKNAIYVNFLNKPEELKQLKWWSEYIKKEQKLLASSLVFEWESYQKELSNTQLECDIYYDSKEKNSLVKLSPGQRQEKNLIITKPIQEIIERTWTHLIVQWKDWKYFIYNYLKQSMITKNIKYISNISQNTICIQDNDNNIRVMCLQEENYIVNISQNIISQVDFKDHINLLDASSIKQENLTWPIEFQSLWANFDDKRIWYEKRWSDYYIHAFFKYSISKKWLIRKEKIRKRNLTCEVSLLQLSSIWRLEQDKKPLLIK